MFCVLLLNVRKYPNCSALIARCWKKKKTHANAHFRGLSHRPPATMWHLASFLYEVAVKSKSIESPFLNVPKCLHKWYPGGKWPQLSKQVLQTCSPDDGLDFQVLPCTLHLFFLNRTQLLCFLLWSLKHSTLDSDWTHPSLLLFYPDPLTSPLLVRVWWAVPKGSGVLRTGL